MPVVFFVVFFSFRITDDCLSVINGPPLTTQWAVSSGCCPFDCHLTPYSPLTTTTDCSSRSAKWSSRPNRGRPSARVCTLGAMIDPAQWSSSTRRPSGAMPPLMGAILGDFQVTSNVGNHLSPSLRLLFPFNRVFVLILHYINQRPVPNLLSS